MVLINPSIIWLTSEVGFRQQLTTPPMASACLQGQPNPEWQSDEISTVCLNPEVEVALVQKRSTIWRSLRRTKQKIWASNAVGPKYHITSVTSSPLIRSWGTAWISWWSSSSNSVDQALHGVNLEGIYSIDEFYPDRTSNNRRFLQAFKQVK